MTETKKGLYYDGHERPEVIKVSVITTVSPPPRSTVWGWTCYCFNHYSCPSPPLPMIPYLVLNKDSLANLQRLKFHDMLIQLLHVGVVSLDQSLLPVLCSDPRLLVYCPFPGLNGIVSRNYRIEPLLVHSLNRVLLILHQEPYAHPHRNDSF